MRTDMVFRVKPKRRINPPMPGQENACPRPRVPRAQDVVVEALRHLPRIYSRQDVIESVRAAIKELAPKPTDDEAIELFRVHGRALLLMADALAERRRQGE